MKRVDRVAVGRISKSSITGILKGSKGYVSSAVTKELKAAGMGGVTQRATSNKADVTRAVKRLQKKGLIPKGTTAYRVTNRAEIRQKEDYKAYVAQEDKILAKKEEKIQVAEEEKTERYIRASVAEDIAEDELKEGNNSDPIRRGGNFKRVVDEVDDDKKTREKEIAEEIEKRQQALLKKASTLKKQSSSMFKESDVIDMGIDG